MRALALLLAVILAMPVHALRRVEANVHAYSLKVVFAGGGHCTGTKIGRSQILLAAHCVTPDLALVILGHVPVEVTKVDIRSGDEARITVNGTFSKWAVIGDPPKQGDEVFIFGNPGDHTDQLRRGYITGERGDGYLLAMLPVWKGDSGSAVFNERGQVVGVISAFTGNEFYTVTVIQPVTR